jgi:signal transduction histidine kinase
MSVDPNRRERELSGLARLELDDPAETIESTLDAAREGLDMDIAYLARFTDDEQVFQALAGDSASFELREGEAMPLGDSYCQRMVDGRIGSVVAETAAEPEVANLALTERAGIGAYVGVPVRFSDGRLYGTFCCLSHAPDPEIGERELRFMRMLARIVAGELERQELRREAERLKDDFVALVSHELRTPLTAIIANLDVLEDETAGLSEEGRRFLGVVDRNARRLLRLVGDLLFVAQVEAGKLGLDEGEVDLEAVARESVEAAAPRALDGGVELMLEAEPVPVVRGDRDRLGQALDNLVSNAIKFTPHGGTVVVRLARDGDRAVLEVSDTGIGISEADMQQLFQRFFRTQRATSAAIPGVGLGLTIAQAIVHGHEGQISVHSLDGEGTTFRIELPLHRTAGVPA